ncbi:hypothetical protein [Geobacillus thermodenitrificans]|jgi:hypothetical protein|nr:hypothetical protein [Geobacillus thermodenitrificans]
MLPARHRLALECVSAFAPIAFAIAAASEIGGNGWRAVAFRLHHFGRRWTMSGHTRCDNTASTRALEAGCRWRLAAPEAFFTQKQFLLMTFVNKKRRRSSHPRPMSWRTRRPLPFPLRIQLRASIEDITENDRDNEINIISLTAL